MRVAQKTIARNYMRNLNATMQKRTESIDRGSSGLKFNKLSDNVSDGSRAMKIQETRYKSEQQLENVENIQFEMNAMDSNMGAIEDVLSTVYEKVLQAKSESYGEDKRAILAQEIGNKKQQILQLVNAKFGDKYLFGGSNNNIQPFTEDKVTHKLLYNGVPMDEIYKDDVDGKYYFDKSDGKTPPTLTKTIVPLNEDVYMDIGLGIRLSADVTPDPRTAFKISFSGMDVMGFTGKGTTTGKDGTQVANNLYDLMTQLEDSIGKNYDKTALGDQLGQLIKLTDKSRMARTELGTRADFLERMGTRLTNEIDNLSAMESNLVSADPASEAIKFKECEYSWLAIMQLGSKVLPASLLDYMR